MRNQLRGCAPVSKAHGNMAICAVGIPISRRIALRRIVVAVHFPLKQFALNDVGPIRRHRRHDQIAARIVEQLGAGQARWDETQAQINLLLCCV